MAVPPPPGFGVSPCHYRFQTAALKIVLYHAKPSVMFMLYPLQICLVICEGQLKRFDQQEFKKVIIINSILSHCQNKFNSIVSWIALK